jgi:pimeloyl-ACP methyl ester carboxylesterase
MRPIEIGPGLVLDALVEGRQGAPAVLLLHGFASSLLAHLAAHPL